MKKAAVFCCAVVLCTALSSCSLPFSTAADLMQAPKLSAEQSAVYSALRVALGTDNFTLKYPRSGNYRSAYVFYDIDGDDVNEAIVFYQMDVENSGTRINILDYVDDSWNSIYDTSADEGDSDIADVDYITFENIQSGDYKNLVIGWQLKSTREKMFSVYSFEDGRLSRQYKKNYAESVFRDFNGDGLMDVVLISLKRNSVTLVTMKNGKIREADSLTISEDTISISQLICGRIPDGRQAIFMDALVYDSYYDENIYATEIITVENSTLTPQINVAAVLANERTEAERGDESTDTLPSSNILALERQQYLSFRATVRTEEILSADRDGNGYIEIPSSTPLLGYEDMPDNEQLFLTTFSVLINNEMTPVYEACVNIKLGYMLQFPKRWRGKVTVLSDSNVNQWRYVRYDGSLEESSSELLRIKRIGKNDFKDRNESEPILLAQTGLYEYYGYLPLTEDKELRLNKEEVQQLFFLL